MQLSVASKDGCLLPTMWSLAPKRWTLLVLIVILILITFVMEWVVPVGAFAQGGGIGTAGSSDTLPPMQRAEEIQTPPFYKKWWFWTLVGAVVIGGVAVAAAGGGGGGNGGSAPQGNTTVTGPALPR